MDEFFRIYERPLLTIGTVAIILLVTILRGQKAGSQGAEVVHPLRARDVVGCSLMVVQFLVYLTLALAVPALLLYGLVKLVKFFWYL